MIPKQLSTVFIFASLLVACNPRQKAEDYFDHDIVVFSLDLEDEGMEIEKILLLDNLKRETKDSLGKQDIAGKKTVTLRCPQKGEGDLRICVYGKRETLCSPGSYVEASYRVHLKLENKTFTTLKWR